MVFLLPTGKEKALLAAALKRMELVTGIIAQGFEKPKPHKPDKPEADAVLGSIAEMSSFSEAEREISVDESFKKRFKLLELARRLLPNSRLSHCYRTRRSNHEPIVGIHRRQKRDTSKKSVKVTNLQHCGKAYCPVCGYQQQRKNQEILLVALAQAEKLGYHAMMVTLTVRHSYMQPADETNKALKKVKDSMFGSGEFWKDLKDEWGIVMKVTDSEVTFGKNGFHPHAHVPMWTVSKIEEPQRLNFEAFLRDKHMRKLKKMGYETDKDDFERGVVVTDGNSVQARYLAKTGKKSTKREWGLAEEATLSNLKKNRKDGLTMLELLAASDPKSEECAKFARLLEIDDLSEAAVRAGQKWVEYVNAFKRGHPLRWSDGAKQLLNLEQALLDFKEANPPPEYEEVPMVEHPDSDEDRGWQRVHSYPQRNRKTGEIELVDKRPQYWALVRAGDAFKLAMWLREHGIEGKIPFEAYAFTARVEQEEQTLLERDE